LTELAQTVCWPKLHGRLSPYMCICYMLYLTDLGETFLASSPDVANSNRVKVQDGQKLRNVIATSVLEARFSREW